MKALGNQFLSHIQAVDLILHVLRCFEDANIISTQAEINPIDDYHIIVAELMLKDLESVIKRLEKIDLGIKKAMGKPLELKELTAEKELLQKIKRALDNAQAKNVTELVAQSAVKTIPLLSAKNFLIIANVSESDMENENFKNNRHYQALVKEFGVDRVVPVCAKLAGELAQLSDEEAQEIMNMIGLKEKSLDSIIRETYKHLGLITFFTCGPKEAHAWPIKKRNYHSSSFRRNSL